MPFQSAVYLVFLALVWCASALARQPAARRAAWLVSSYAFYATWGPAFLSVLVGSSLFNYAWGALLRRHSRPGILWIGLGANILLLVCFKYVGWGLGVLGVESPPFLELIAPVGVSFYTFQGMSYLLDVYRGAEDARPSLLEFLLYMAFWPTVLAGPVCRVGEIVPQLRRAQSPTLDDVAIGVRRILLGLFMKVVLGDMLGYGITSSEGVDTGFDSLSGGWSGVDVWFLAVGFGFQLFFDFAGYSHVAIGSARLFGIRLRENFDSPYLSRTPAEFWTRWHMSLSSWIRDYLFFPLATLRRGFWWRAFALVVSMTVFGIWHGAGGTFALWGLYQGVLLAGHRVIERVWPQQRRGGGRTKSAAGEAIAAALSGAATFALISLGWVLFRANDLTQAFTMLRAVVSPASYGALSMRLNFYVLVATVAAGYFTVAGLAPLLHRARARPAVARLTWMLSPAFYAAMVTAIVVWSRQTTTFVYLQF